MTEAALLLGFAPQACRTRLERPWASGDFVGFRRPTLQATLYLSLDAPLWCLEFDEQKLAFTGDSAERMLDTLSQFIGNVPCFPVPAINGIPEGRGVAGGHFTSRSQA